MTSSKAFPLAVRLIGAGLLLVGCAAGESVDHTPCIVPVEEALVCTMDYVPVCGCDTRTYGNACAARAAGVQRFEPGECGDAGADPVR